MIEFEAGTYPYRNRHAIMEAVQAGLLPHTRCAGDEAHEGCVTVLIRVVAPQSCLNCGHPTDDHEAGNGPCHYNAYASGNSECLCPEFAIEADVPPEVVPAWDFSDAVRERAEHWDRRDRELGWLPPAMVASLESRGIDPYAAPSTVDLPSAGDVMPEGKE